MDFCSLILVKFFFSSFNEDRYDIIICFIRFTRLIIDVGDGRIFNGTGKVFPKKIQNFLLFYK
jgi:hypothetical protein